MRRLAGSIALVTGADGYIGQAIARRLAMDGISVAVSGLSAGRIARLAGSLRQGGGQAIAVPGDLAATDTVERIVAATETELGPVDLLVNNAALEVVAPFASTAPALLSRAVTVNLTAPVLLTRRVLPGMLERDRGHVVFMSSAAGKLGTAYGQSYVAGKAGMIAVAQALRAEYARTSVGFSVICPGFVTGGGMYQRCVDRGIAAGRLLGSTSAERVVEAVRRAIREDRPEIVLTGRPVRLVFALAQVVPSLAERMMARAGATEFFARVAADAFPAPPVKDARR